MATHILQAAARGAAPPSGLPAPRWGARARGRTKRSEKGKTEDDPRNEGETVTVHKVETPTEEEVMSTPMEDRWGRYDDPSCANCRDLYACGDNMPCCLPARVSCEAAWLLSMPWRLHTMQSEC